MESDKSNFVWNANFWDCGKNRGFTGNLQYLSG